MELRNVTSFLSVAELGSFTAAAKALGYTQGTITIQIRQLEEELGTVLFDRDVRGVTLTEAGNDFIPYAQAICKSIKEAENFCKEEQEISGELRICATSSISVCVLPEIISEFKSSYPKINITLTSSDNESDILYKVLHNETDFAYWLRPPRAIDGCITLIDEPEEIITIANNNYPLVDKSNVSIEEIIKHPLIITERNASYSQYLKDILMKSDIKLSPDIDVSSGIAIRELLLNNDSAVSFLPWYAVKNEIEEGRLKRVNTMGINILEHRQLFYNKRKWLNPQMRVFIDFINSR